MTIDQTRTSVHHHVEVDVTPDRAFETFLQLDRIKPREHNLLPVAIEETVIEHRAGGDVYDRGVDGSVCRWAKVLAFEPPHRLLLRWDISPSWQVEPDPARTSEVEIRFTGLAEGRTRVDLEHRFIDRHGAGWESERDGLEGDGGWPLYLQRFAELTAGAPVAE